MSSWGQEKSGINYTTDYSPLKFLAWNRHLVFSYEETFNDEVEESYFKLKHENNGLHLKLEQWFWVLL